MKNFTTRLQRDITTNHPIFLTNRSKLWVFVKICKKSLGTDRLQKGDLGGSIESTITKNGHRTRQTCGIFLSQIYLSERGKDFPYTLQKAVFVARSIRRNKAEFIRTNKASRFFAVVEALSHPLGNGNSYLLNKEKITMLFKFLLLGEKRLTVRIRAKSETEARQRLNLSKSTAICIARFSDNLTACNRPNFGEMGEIVHSPMVDGHAYSTSTNGVSDTEQKTILHPFALIGYSAPVVAKSTASREKLNDETLANSSTPLTRAFFVRSLRTPKENAFLKNKERSFLSMVGRIGQRLGVGCVPKFAVSHPDTSYRPAVRSQAVARKSNFRSYHNVLQVPIHRLTPTHYRIR